MTDEIYSAIEVNNNEINVNINLQNTTINSKASQTDLDALTTTVGTKVSWISFRRIS